MKRFFAFGCSHVNYHYPTWADILIHELSLQGVDGFNCGRIGSGNQLISHRVWEANATQTFNEDDLIIISWTNFFRDDRYHTKQGWHTPGNIVNNRTDFPLTLNNFTYRNGSQWYDIMHYLQRDCAIITSTVNGLKATGATVYTTHMGDPYLDEYLLEIPQVKNVLDLYKDTVKGTIDSIMNHCWYEGVGEDKSRPVYRNEMAPSVDIIEDHPIPLEHLDYLKEVVSPKIDVTISSDTEEYARYWQKRLYENNKGFYPLQDWYTKELEWIFG